MPKPSINTLIDQVHETPQPPRWNIFHFESCSKFFLVGFLNRFASRPFLKGEFTYTRNFHLLCISTYREDRGLHFAWFPNWGSERGGRSVLAIYSNEGDITVSILFMRISFR